MRGEWPFTAFHFRVVLKLGFEMSWEILGCNGADDNHRGIDCFWTGPWRQTEEESVSRFQEIEICFCLVERNEAKQVDHMMIILDHGSHRKSLTQGLGRVAPRQGLAAKVQAVGNVMAI